MHVLIFQAHHTPFHQPTPKNKECGQFFQSGLIKGEENETYDLCLQRAVATTRLIVYRGPCILVQKEWEYCFD